MESGGLGIRGGFWLSERGKGVHGMGLNCVEGENKLTDSCVLADVDAGSYDTAAGQGGSVDASFLPLFKSSVI